MHKSTNSKAERKDDGRFNWVMELAVFATITPALIYGVLSLQDLPIV